VARDCRRPEATLVWQGDLVSSTTLASLHGVERMGSSTAMMRETQKFIERFLSDIGEGSMKLKTKCRSQASLRNDRCALAGRRPESNASAVSWETEASFSASLDSEFRGGGFRGDVGEVDFGLRAVASAQFGGGPLFRFGVEWQRYDFGLSSGALIPNTCNPSRWLSARTFNLARRGSSDLKPAPAFTATAQMFARTISTFP